MLRRLELLHRCNQSERLRRIELEVCRRDRLHWLDCWVWTTDPRLSSKGLLAHIPFDLFEAQRELVLFLQARLDAQEDGVIEKSRDMGASWILAALAVHAWLFQPGFKTTYTSYAEDKVDRIGNPDSWFEKVRQLLRLLPPWMLPVGYSPRLHDNFMRLVNPVNGNVISGETGDNMGRAGRSSWVLMDECAFMDHPDAIDAATAANTRCRIFASTVNGMGNLLARKRHGGHLLPEQIFRLHWTRDPRKTVEDPGWEARERKRMDAWKFASEYDIDYAASVEGVFIPAKWVESCWRIAELPNFQMPQPDTFGVAGQDVGAGGSGKSVNIARFGPIVKTIVSWGDPDTIETALRALDECQKANFVRDDGWDCRVGCLNFDEPGIGVAVRDTFTRVGVPGLTTQGINTGSPPTERMWNDGQTSKEKFANLKAELWAIARERVKCTHETYLALTGQDGGQIHPSEELLILPPPVTPDATTLITQLSYPRRERAITGKIAVESKKVMMGKRGLPSPDHADTLVLTFAMAELDVWARLAQGVAA